MTLNLRLAFPLAVACALAGCPADDSGQDTDGATSSPMTTPMTTADPSGMSGMMTTAPIDTTGEPEPDDTSTGGTETGDSSTTGEPPASCVDLDLRSMIGPNVASGSTVGAGNDFDSTCFGGGPGTTSPTGGGGSFDSGGDGGGDGGFDTGFEGDGDDYVIQWTAPAAGVYTFSLDGSQYDTLLAVHNDCDTRQIECNDDCIGLMSGIQLTLAAGETILLVVDGFAGRTGDFTLSIGQGRPLDCGFGDTDSGFDSGFDEGGGFVTGGDPTN